MGSAPQLVPRNTGASWPSARGQWLLPTAPLPVWARTVDLASVLLIVIACLVAAFGGFRERIGDLRLSITSWERLAVAAMALLAVRHAVARQDALPFRLARLFAAVRASRAVKAVVPAFIGTRLPVLVAGYFAAVLIGFAPGSVLFSVSDSPFANLPARWDAGWYLHIVQDGYLWNGNPAQQQNVVFFPAMPVLMYAVGLLMGRQWLLAGTVVALCAFAWALVYAYRLARDLLGDQAAAAAPWFIAAYPFAVYFAAPYTESLFLLACLGAFFHLERSEWRAAAAWGLLAGLCRPNGFLLALPLGWIAVRRLWTDGRTAWRHVLAPAAPVLGLALYSAYLAASVGDPLAWLKGQLAWGRVFVGVWPGLQALVMDRYSAIEFGGLVGYTARQPMDAMNTCAALFALAAMIPVMRRLGLAYAAFMAINLFPPLVMGGMMSIGRMTSVLFPAFLWLAAVVPSGHRMAWIAAWMTLQGLIAVLFFTWRPAF